jgi:hypothetical protein
MSPQPSMVASGTRRKVPASSDGLTRKRDRPATFRSEADHAPTG